MDRLEVENVEQSTEEKEYNEEQRQREDEYRRIDREHFNEEANL
jgi:hypothetical protein